MDYFNANTNCYPTSPSSGFNAHLNQMPAPEHVAFDFGGLETSPHDWSLSGQQVYASGSQDSLRSEGTFGKCDCNPFEVSYIYLYLQSPRL